MGTNLQNAAHSTQKLRMFCQTMLLALFVALLPSSSRAFAQSLELPVQPGPTFELYKSSRALIISANKYADNNAWPNLPDSEAGADRLAAYLKEHGFSEIVRLKDRPGAELRESIRQFLVTSPPDSRSIIYFGGHGATDPLDKRRGYIVPSDAPDPAKNLAGFRLSAISTLDLQSLSQMAAGRHTLLIADSCFSGALIPSQGGFQASVPGVFPPKPRYWETIGLPRFQIITASEDWEKIPAKSKLADRLIEGLDGASDTFGYGFTTAYNLAIWLRHKALDDDKGTNPLFSSISLINPVTSQAYADGGDMVFATPKSAGNPVIPTRFTPPPPVVRGPVKLYRTQDAGVPPPPGLTYRSSFLGEFEPSKVFADVKVEYYKKIGDGTRATTAMDRLGIPYSAKPAQIAYDVTNAIACHADVDVNAFKTLVIGLIEEGVEIRMIKQYVSPFPSGVGSKEPPVSSARYNTIQVLSAKGGAFERAKPITVEQVRSMTGCPAWFQN